MTTYKRIDGDYNITTINSNDNVNVTTNTLNIYGNLDVLVISLISIQQN